MFIELINKGNGAGNISFVSPSMPENHLSVSLETDLTFPTTTIRIALQSGDKEKANLMLGGDISRVDPATAERLTTDITQKAAEWLLDISTNFRRQGLFLLPFRFFTMTMTPDGTLSNPSPQAIALPTDYPPHPEITAAQATDDTLTLALRLPARPHRLTVSLPANTPSGHSPRTYISYPLYIPDPKEMRGSIGSVRSATGGNATGIRFAFLSTSSIKASVAAPEKYYELTGNEKTGYRLSTKATPPPDYSCLADIHGHVTPFPRDSLTAIGEGVDPDTDPMDWIADWRNVGNGYLPNSLPYKHYSGETWQDGIDKDEIAETAEDIGMPYILLTRPIVLAGSLLNAEAKGIRTMRVHGLGDSQTLAILYGSDDGAHWSAIRRFDPQYRSLLLTPRRFWWRLLLYGEQAFQTAALGLEIETH